MDEISEISHNLQTKLLRIIQEKEYERVGGETVIPMKARIIAATNKNLEELAGQGKIPARFILPFEKYSLLICLLYGIERKT